MICVNPVKIHTQIIVHINPIKLLQCINRSIDPIYPGMRQLVFRSAVAEYPI